MNERGDGKLLPTIVTVTQAARSGMLWREKMMKKAYAGILFALGLVGVAASCQTGSLTVAPGLSIKSGATPWALDTFSGKPELVPIHHSTVTVNNHTGANIAGSIAGSVFYKPKMTTEVEGLHARSVLHSPKPTIYVHVQTDDDAGGESASSNIATWVLVRATVGKDRRVFAKVQFTQLTGNAKRNDGVVQTTTETMPGSWLRLTPTADLTPGEYAVTPIFKVQNTFSTVVFDFSLDPAAPNASDAVLPEQTDSST